MYSGFGREVVTAWMGLTLIKLVCCGKTCVAFASHEPARVPCTLPWLSPGLRRTHIRAAEVMGNCATVGGFEHQIAQVSGWIVAET